MLSVVRVQRGYRSSLKRWNLSGDLNLIYSKFINV